VLVVVDQSDVYEFIVLADHYGLEARDCGLIEKSTDSPRLVINSKYNDKQIVFSSDE